MFKSYTSNDNLLLPPCLGDFISLNDPIRVVHRIIEQISSRRIEEFCRNDIRFMWLTGNLTPDHNTINRFRGSRLKDVLKTIFATIVKFFVA